MNRLPSSKLFRAFTLIEMLVVIAIIALLAAMIFPAVGKAKTAAKSKAAKSEISGLLAAINQYQSEYSRLPAAKEAVNALQPSASNPDFTFGLFDTNGNPIAHNITDSNSVPVDQLSPKHISNRATISNYQAPNSQVMDIITGITRGDGNAEAHYQTYNPRKINFFSPKMGTGQNVPGLDPNNVLRDPWGNPYIITLDLSYDNKCTDGFYAWLTKDTNGIPGTAIIWSAGPDQKINADRNATNPAHNAENKDNIVSWE